MPLLRFTDERLSYVSDRTAFEGGLRPFPLGPFSEVHEGLLLSGHRRLAPSAGSLPAHVVIALTEHYARVRHRLGIHVTGARFLHRQAVSRLLAFSRAVIGVTMKIRLRLVVSRLAESSEGR